MDHISHVELLDSALEVTMGSYVPSSGAVLGGFGFYMGGPAPFLAQLSTAKHVMTHYSVWFQSDWEWQKGGKLSGQYGGVGDLAFGSSGGREDNRDQCFDLRFITNGAGELYSYLPLTDDNAAVLAAIPSRTIENSDFWFSVGRGAWTLNDPGKNNGVIQVWVHGTTMIHVTGLEMRNSRVSTFRGMHSQTFFGGGSQDYAPETQKAWFTDISGAIIG
ncbi:polysaccharide lyase family 14 protein [Ramaria rubella]|nr:polysaccharide lyase family 14 protein [Ramaria rubella]